MDGCIHTYTYTYTYIYIYYVFCLLTVQPVSAKLHLHSCSSCGFLIFFSLCSISLVFAVSLLKIKTRHESTYSAYSASNLNTKCKTKLGSFVKHCLFHFAPWQEQAVTEQATLMSFCLQTTPEIPKQAPLAAEIVQYYGPQQKIQHNMSNMSTIAKFHSHPKPKRRFWMKIVALKW